VATCGGDSGGDCTCGDLRDGVGGNDFELEKKNSKENAARRFLFLSRLAKE